MKKILKVIGLSIILAVVGFFILLFSGVIWRSPKYFTGSVVSGTSLPIMDMAAYDTLGHHRRPYIYKIENANGSVYVLGIEHTKDDKNPQIDSIRTLWESFKPDVALVVVRLGFLFSWFQDPVHNHGEGGETVRLAKKYHIPYYTWEPDKRSEINMLVKQFPPKQVALFYSLRPYFSNFRFGKPENPEEKMNEYIQSRTDFDLIRGEIKDYHEVNSIWKAEKFSDKDWRETSDEYGWPKGYLSDLASQSNMARDMHMCNVIIELVNQGNKVFVTMGSSHAFRIEKALRAELEK